MHHGHRTASPAAIARVALSYTSTGRKGLRIANVKDPSCFSGLLVDCLPLVNRQLDGILVLVRRLSTCNTDEGKLKVFRDLCNKAVLHVLSRERVLLPAWRRAKWKEFPLASFQAHVRLKRALAELVVRPPAAEGHSAAMTAFADLVNHQRVIDSEILVPLLRSAMDVPQRRDVCNDLELLFEADRVVDELSLCIDTSSHNLVHEAELVLSSLTPHREVERECSRIQSPTLGLM